MKCKVCDRPIKAPAGLNGEILCHSCWDWAHHMQSGAQHVADYLVRSLIWLEKSSTA